MFLISCSNMDGDFQLGDAVFVQEVLSILHGLQIIKIGQVFFDILYKGVSFWML